MTNRMNHERVFEFLCTCERRKVKRVISQFFYPGDISFIGEKVMEKTWDVNNCVKKIVNNPAGRLTERQTFI